MFEFFIVDNLFLSTLEREDSLCFWDEIVDFFKAAIDAATVDIVVAVLDGIF